jgi:hypothetical protein|uniref:Uncharacterized protein n=1 Tax=Zea mays TaxID=4577 RepID=A0A804M5S8_MAIZE
MGFSEHVQNTISKLKFTLLSGEFFLKKPQFRFVMEEHLHQFTQSKRERKKGTLKRIVTDHMKAKFISSGCCCSSSLWTWRAAAFERHLCRGCDLSCVMLLLS